MRHGEHDVKFPGQDVNPVDLSQIIQVALLR